MSVEVTGDFIYQLHGFLNIFLLLISCNGGMWLLFALFDVFTGQKWPWCTAAVLAIVAIAGMVLKFALPGGTVYVNIV